jgi:hypothetical protein
MILPPVRAGIGQTKNPRLTVNRGFFGNSIWLRLENASHDASALRYAVPNGHLALATQNAQAIFKRGVHFFPTASMKHHPAAIVK